jgi:tRNA-2-methylthio-N6-dimethylallyladenosine synthase
MYKKPNNLFNNINLPNTSLARKRLLKSNTQRNLFKITAKHKRIGLHKTYFIKTYGCQLNTRDSEDIAGILESMCYRPAKTIDTADLVILNTCAVRENAEKKVFGKIGFFKNKKQKHPNFLFGVCGCMCQEVDVVNKIVQKLKHVDFVFGTHNIYMLADILDQVVNHRQRVIHVYSKEGDIIEGLPNVRKSPIKAFINIMYGCDKFCTYCIVPYTRGQIRSRSKEDILAEINNLKNNGYKEITLLGQNVNSYGLDFNNQYRFADLLLDVAKTGIARIRFATSNP